MLALLGCTVALTSCGGKKKQRLQVEVSEGPAVMGFEDLIVNLGNVKRTEDKSHVFVYYNLGSEPLVINEVRTDCNCVQAEYSKEPVKPGGSGELKLTVIGRGLEPGKFRRAASVFTNAKNNPMNLMVEGYAESLDSHMKSKK